jgi:hypothetical protein
MWWIWVVIAVLIVFVIVGMLEQALKDRNSKR